ALLLGAVMIGFAPIFVRLTDVGYTACAFWRAALALPVLAIVARPRVHQLQWNSLRWLLLAGLFFGADLAVWHQSIRLTSVANATLLANFAPVFVTGAAVLVLHERVRASFVGGLVLALAGAATLVGNSALQGGGNVLGDLCGIGASVFYAGYLIVVARARSRYRAAEVMLWTSLATAALLLLIASVEHETMWPQSARGWGVVLGLALLSQVLGQGLIAYALAHLSAAFSAAGLLVQPVAAALLAWLLLGEPFGWRQGIGGVIVLAGIVLCRLSMPTAPPE
ncbi:MAG TPA: DMT family transporter, partial [Nevskiaceae bacterium]|nr:DMT family transporter [Nevskiaceae bacterium]